MKLQLNSSFYDKLDKVERQAEEAVEEKMKEIADDAINFTVNTPQVKSAVDTGAYITSFYFAGLVGRNRGKSSHGKTKGASVTAMADQGRQQLYSDLSKLSLKGSTKIVLGNGSPHAEYVEHKHGHKVFTRLRRKHG